jgi:shikimate dehydrogenase
MDVPYAEVIGDPIDHSASPFIHKFWLEQIGLDGDYRATRVTRETLRDYLEARRSDPAWRGCNVTMPLKQAAAEFLDEANQSVVRLGATNCILRQGNRLYGTNFDGDAMLHMLLPSEWSGHAVIIGNGGAARAALWALSSLFRRISVMGRDAGGAAEMINRLRVRAAILPLGGSPECEFLVNATPLGMEGQPPLPIGLEGMSSDGAVFDMVYKPVLTPLLAAARRRGMCVFDGLTMLIEQASMSFVSFFKASIDNAQRLDVRRALES